MEGKPQFNNLGSYVVIEYKGENISAYVIYEDANIVIWNRGNESEVHYTLADEFYRFAKLFHDKFIADLLGGETL